MMNPPQVTNPRDRLRVRRQAETRARRAMVQLMCAVAILRRGLTQVTPAAGAAAWWVTLLCLLPWLALYALAALLMRRCGASTLAEALRARLGRRVAGALAILGGLVLLAEAAATLTSLITLFTRGIGTRGTRLTLSLLTGGALLPCLHREGLPRAVYLLRRGLAAAFLLAGALCLQGMRGDALFPLTGDGLKPALAALPGAWWMGWPLLLPLTIPEDSPRARWTAPCPALLTALCGMLLICLSAPHELLLRSGDLAESLMLPAYFAPPPLRLLMHCLIMLACFLAIGGTVMLAGSSIRSDGEPNQSAARNDIPPIRKEASP